MLPKFVSLRNRQKILEHYLELERDKKTFLGWQPHEDGDRLKAEISVEQVIPEKNIFLSHIQYCEFDPFIYQDNGFFMKDVSDEWASKSQLVAPSRERLILTLPEEILFLEKRAFPRFQFNIKQYLEVVLSVRTGLRRRTFKLALRDISSNGAKVAIPNKILPFFFEGEDIMIHQIGCDRFGTDFDGEIIRMMQPVCQVKKTTHHLGISFKRMLSEELLVRQMIKMTG